MVVGHLFVRISGINRKDPTSRLPCRVRILELIFVGAGWRVMGYCAVIMEPNTPPTLPGSPPNKDKPRLDVGPSFGLFLAGGCMAGGSNGLYELNPDSTPDLIQESLRNRF